MDLSKYPLLFEPHFCSVSPEAQSFVEMEGELNEENIAEFNRGRIEFLAEWHDHAPIDNVERSDFSYQNGIYSGSGIVYRPLECDGKNEKNGKNGKKLPAIVFYHGGGWTTLCKECYEYECAEFAKQANCVVFNLDYRCAPKYKFPIPLEDCYAALQEVVKKAADYGADADRIALAGDSAGGNLALGVAILTRRRNGPKIRYMALAYPAVGFDEDSGEMIESVIMHYAGDKEKLDDPLISPILDDEIEKMPPMLIVIGTCDFLLDQNLRFVRRLQESGNDVELALYQGMPHGFIQMVTPPGVDSVKLISQKIKEHLE